MVMETSEEEPLSIESFSYSWLSNSNSNLRRTSFDDPPPKPSLGNSPPTAFENPLEKPHNNFDFHTAISHSQAPFVHADEVFSNGIIRPVFADNPIPNHRAGALPTRTQKPSLSNLPIRWLEVEGLPFHMSGAGSHGSGENPQRRFFKRFFHISSFLHATAWKDAVEKIGSGSRGDVSVADWRFREICSWNRSPQQSPPRTSHSVGHSSDNETSIDDAILHCKRSICSHQDYYYET